MSTLTIIRGASGSGKSTLAKKLAACSNSNHFEADMYFYVNGKYEFNFRKLKDAHEWCQDSVKNAMSLNKPVIVSNTFTKIWEMQPYLDMAVKYGYVVQVIHCQGNFKNIHGVPDEKVKQMLDNFEPYILP